MSVNSENLEEVGNSGVKKVGIGIALKDVGLDLLSSSGIVSAPLGEMLGTFLEMFGCIIMNSVSFVVRLIAVILLSLHSLTLALFGVRVEHLPKFVQTVKEIDENL